MSIAIGRSRLVAGICLLVAAAVVTTWAQGLGPSSAGSLAELTAEVRQLRATIQDASRSQNQMQALSISLTAQQSRLAQVSARLDAAQLELEKAQDKTQQLTNVVTEAQKDPVPANMSAEDRAERAEMLKMLRAEADRAQASEGAIRARINDLTNAFRAEEARWLELVARLEEIIKR